MNILITGAGGFIGKNLSLYLSKMDYNITTITREKVNLLDYDSVHNFFCHQQQPFDVVIHTAIEGGRRIQRDRPEIVYNNLLMLCNLLTHQNNFQCIISLGSGAEMDKRYDVNPSSINRYPIDPYGLSKNMIDKLCYSENRLCNFRIFNCFGIGEQPDRMIRNNIQKYINKQDMVIHKDRRMDFFHVSDLALVLDFFIKNNNIPKIFDCCYKDKTNLSDIANIINNLDSHKVNIIYESKDKDLDYYGQCVQLPIEYLGLQKGIEQMYNFYCGRNND